MTTRMRPTTAAARTFWMPLACGTNGLIPHGNPVLVITGVATGVAGVPATFSFLDFLPYNFHCWGLLIIFFLSIMTGIGRKRRKTA